MMSSHGGRVESGLDRPHSARIWNYWLGGKDYYPADRRAGDVAERIVPGLAESARADRAFLGRCVRHLVTERGIRQFLDIGAGLPAVGSTHEVAQRLAPDSRIVYVDHDPLVLAHARTLLTSTPQGATCYADGDLRRPDDIMKTAAEILDLTRPVALMLLGVLDHVPDDATAARIVGRLLESVPPGSHLVLAHPTAELHGDAMHEAMRRLADRGPLRVVRDRTRLSRLFAGLTLLEPGVVSCSRWRPDDRAPGTPAEVSRICGVARKP